MKRLIWLGRIPGEIPLMQLCNWYHFSRVINLRVCKILTLFMQCVFQNIYIAFEGLIIFPGKETGKFKGPFLMVDYMEYMRERELNFANFSDEMICFSFHVVT